eukprot:TRINITY_DN302_c5_g1_i1.p1 TRINITY_DN302_c5_g1~~TRINITY_DN302_c5_g1_i1.p1  ORF type:complete len:524 (-),score=137.64 TRINITY_DN302_c5_g1_i1:53-1624(-)
MMCTTSPRFSVTAAAVLLLSLLCAVDYTEAKSSCFLETISLNESACEDYWFGATAYMCLTFLVIVFHIGIMLNLYRTPWATAEAEVMDVFYDWEEPTVEEPEETLADDVNMCERCGTKRNVNALYVPGATLMLCAGCVCYKDSLRAFALYAIVFPLTFLVWFTGIDASEAGAVLVYVLCTLCLCVFFFIGILVTWCTNSEAFQFWFSRRERVSKSAKDDDLDGGGGRFQRLERTLPPEQQALIDCAKHKRHAKALRLILHDNETIEWVEAVPVWRYVRNNHNFQSMLWLVCCIPFVWGGEMLFLFLAADDVDNDTISYLSILLSLVVTLPVLCLIIPWTCAMLVKTRVTYALTNKRALRINSSLFWFASRVYSYPYSRMLLLATQVYPGGGTEGKVMWLPNVEGEEAFLGFEYVANTTSSGDLIKSHKNVVQEICHDNEDEKDEEVVSFRRNTYIMAQVYLTNIFVVAFVLVLFLLLSLTGGYPIIVVIPFIPMCTWIAGLFFLLYRKQMFILKCSNTTCVFA